MIKEIQYQGTFFTKFTTPIMESLMNYSLLLGYEWAIEQNMIRMGVVVNLVINEFPYGIKNDVLGSKSVYNLIIENGVTAEELFEVIKQAIDNLKICPHCNPKDVEEYLSIIPYPPIEHEMERLINIVEHVKYPF